MVDPIIQALVQRRHDLGLKQTEIGERMSRSVSEVCRIEGGRDVRLSTLRRYAETLDVDLVAVLR